MELYNIFFNFVRYIVRILVEYCYINIGYYTITLPIHIFIIVIAAIKFCTKNK